MEKLYGRRPSYLLHHAEDQLETIIAARNPYMAWRFSFTPDGDNCTFTTSLALQALADAARVDGTEMDLASRREALLYLKSMTDSSSGRVGYMEQGSEDPRFRERVDDYPTKYTELCTAMAVIAQDRAGVDLLDDPTTLRSLTLVATKPPVWNRTHGSVDYYYWMFGAEAVKDSLVRLLLHVDPLQAGVAWGGRMPLGFGPFGSF